ncbi:protein C10 [Chrysoperla carnea]|uniref:protein C10 n=1 Tax=Chrysoperla carnea TaxID=189513 RepID=UPI001D0702D9|nr:protein C10 [Chrysoperla carnea]
MSNFTVENAIAALNDILEELNTEENSSKLQEARESIGNEMLKMMQYVFPMIMEIEMNVIKKYGFVEGREGIVKFSQMIRQFEKEDAEVARLHNLLRAYYLPSVAVATTADCPYEVSVET